MKINSQLISLRRQAGNLLISAATALGVYGVVQVGTVTYMVSKAYEAKGTAIGSQMRQIQGMLDSYVSTNYSALQNPTPVIAGVTNPLAPTLTELQNLGLPNTAGISAPAGGGTYQISITLSPAGCSPGTCNVRAKVWLDSPIRQESGNIDLRVLGAAVAAGTGGMGFSLPGTPTTIESAAGWTEPNPDPLGRAGILLAVTGYDASALSGLIRRDGTRSATANHDWGGHDLTNMATAQASNIEAANNVSAGGWLRNTTAGTGWYNDAHDVGMYAQDSAWVRAYNNAGIYTGGQMQAGSIQSNGGITAVGQVTAYAPSYNFTDYWSVLGYGAGGTANSSPQSAIGSAYLNDAYFRSIGKWASQMGAGTLGASTWVSAPNAWSSCQWCSKVAVCPAGYVMTGASFVMQPSGVDDEHVDALCTRLQ